MLVVKARTKITFTAGHLHCSTLAMDLKDGTLPPRVDSDWCLYSPKERKQDSTCCSAQYYRVTLSTSKKGRRLLKYKLQTRYLNLI